MNHRAALYQAELRKRMAPLDDVEPSSQPCWGVPGTTALSLSYGGKLSFHQRELSQDRPRRGARDRTDATRRDDGATIERRQHDMAPLDH
jgi:hypothetical protein